MGHWDNARFDEEEEKGANMSVWRNPTKDKVRFPLPVGSARPMGRKPTTRLEATGCRIVEVAPGETITLESQYDNAIRTVSASNAVIGGYAPQLVKEGEEIAPTRSALFNHEVQQRKAAEAARSDAAQLLAQKEAEIMSLRERLAEQGISTVTTASDHAEAPNALSAGPSGGHQSPDHLSQKKKG